MMEKIIAIVNQKGGVGKTTTAVNLGAALSDSGKRVLLVDLDPQGSLTTSLGVNVAKDGNTAFELLRGDKPAQEVIRHTKRGYDLIPGDLRLTGIEKGSNDVVGREYLLKEALEDVTGAYDYVLVDCSPSLGVLSLNALTACDAVLIPTQAEYLALTGLAQLTQTIAVARRRLNPSLTISGVVMTMYDRRKNLTAAVEARLGELFPGKLCKTRIRCNVALAEAPTQGVDIFAYDPRSNGAKDYQALADELTEKEQ